MSLKFLENYIKKQSSDLEQKIKLEKVYIITKCNTNYILKSLDEYLEYKSLGYIIKIEN